MRIAATIIALCALVGCDDDPADFEGNFTIAVTSRDNGCNFDNWMEGDTASNIQMTITQEGAEVTATIEGLVGAYLNLVLGDNEFNGDADGNDVVLTLFGTNSATEGNCTYTVNGVVDGELNGDVLEGQLRYEAATNGNPDCAALEGCASVQDFNGTRPPS
ncbi:MAG: hypothetical protein KJO07_24175 [Deltaproteobacteria bacterium]|nr:hypothetical protein [Deltaproteobacteria bacterium]